LKIKPHSTTQHSITNYIVTAEHTILNTLFQIVFSVRIIATHVTL